MVILSGGGLILLIEEYLVDMLFFACLILLVLIVLNYRAEGNFCYPPLLMSFVWFAVLFMFSIFDVGFYDISISTLLVYIAGIVAFSLGGGCARMLFSRVQIARVDLDHKWVNFVLNFTILVSLISAPLYVYNCLP